MSSSVITLEDGRRLGISAAGDPTADRLVLFCHPSPGSSRFDPDPVLTGRWGVHLVSLDRPGYGASDPLPAGAPHRIADRARELAGLIRGAEKDADRISNADYTTLGVIGWGAGGLVAAAIAAAQPDRVDRLALVDVPSPRKAAKLARRAFIAPQTSAALHIAEDAPELTQHVGLLNRVEHMVEDAFLQGRAGVEADRLLMADDRWLPGLSGIRARTGLWVGEGNDTVGEDDARWWVKHVPDASAHLVRGASSLAIAAAWERVLGFVAPEHGDLARKERDTGPVRIADVDPVHPEQAKE